VLLFVLKKKSSYSTKCEGPVNYQMVEQFNVQNMLG